MSEARWRRWVFGRHPRRTAVRTVTLAIVVWIVATQWLRPCWVDGVSMEPTIADGSFNLINLRAYRTSAPQRGDIVAARMHSLDNKNFLLKRVIGLPGESISFEDGLRHIDGRPAPEPYLAERGHWNVPPIGLGPDEYFIVGDNRSVPWQRHTAGAIGRIHLIGGIVLE